MDGESEVVVKATASVIMELTSASPFRGPLRQTAPLHCSPPISVFQALSKYLR